MNKAALINNLGKVPIVETILRRMAGVYKEGSVVNIYSGLLKGYRWQRDHHYENGYWLGNYELEIQRALADLLEPGEVFYDIGANAGFFSLLAANCVGPQGHIYMFEPLPYNIKVIPRQMELNGIGNYHLIERAVSSEIGTVEFCTDIRTSYSHIRQTEDIQGELIKVATITLDEFTRSNRWPNVIKMDIEGAELMALQGAKQLLTSPGRPKWLIELHGEKEATVKVANLLTESDYQIVDRNHHPVSSDNLPRHIIAKPKD